MCVCVYDGGCWKHGVTYYVTFNEGIEISLSMPADTKR